MATPQESITTVNGRRCTRSRARTAATSIFSSEAAVVTPTEVTSSALTSEQQQRLETTAPDIPPQAAQPAPAQESTEEQQQAVAPSTQQAAASSAIGTQSVVPTPTPIAQQQATQLADTPLPFPPPPPPPPTEPLPAVLEEPAPAEATQTEAVVSAAAEITTTAPTTTSTQSTSSNPTIETAVSSSSPSTSRSSVIISSTFAIPSEPTAPVESSIQSSIPALPEGPAQSLIPTTPSPGEEEQPQPQPQPPDSAESEFPSSGSAGIISPEEGSLDGVGGLTIPANGQASIGSIVGGVVGGFVGIALISALLFLCLRKRKSRGFQKWNEKAVRRSAWKDKLRAIPAGFGMFFAKLKGKKTGPAENPYSRHTARSSISSVYSQGSNGHNRSMSEPPKQQSFAGRILSIKKSKNLLHKKQDSLVTGAKSPFPGIVEDPVVRNSKGLDDPFADPVEPPRTLLLLNPDQNDDDNRKTQQPRLTIPKPAAVPQRASRDPFQSILDELDERDGSGTPEWLKDSGHKRTTSAATALQSHPPSNYTASVYTLKDPFRDSQAPPVPTQPLPPNPPKQPGNMYGAGFPAFNATSTNASRDSNYSFFGEPGPSRPNTNMFTTSGRYGRQSDPFDLDRPEVLGFGNVTGRREVRASVTRQNSRSNRASSVPNWVSVEDGPYERASAVPGPLRNPSVRR